MTDIEFWIQEALDWAAHEQHLVNLVEDHLFGHPIQHVDMEGAIGVANIALGTFNEIVSAFIDE